MKTPTFLEGVGIALAASLVGSVTHAALAAVVGAGALRLIVAGLALAYVAYLLARSPGRVGRVTAFAAWGAMAGLLWLAAPPLALYLVLHLGAIWLVRSLFFHSSLLSAAADLGLSVLSLAAAVWALVHTASLPLGIWCFFLVQALFVAIPPSLASRAAVDRQDRDDPFEHAHRVAEAAVRRLTSVR
jgi:hypothetical protein